MKSNKRKVYQIVCEFCNSSTELRFDIQEDGVLPLFCPFCGEEQDEEEFAEIDQDDANEYGDVDDFEDEEY